MVLDRSHQNVIQLEYRTLRARSSVGLERVPPEHKVRGSSPFGRATSLQFIFKHLQLYSNFVSNQSLKGINDDAVYPRQPFDFLRSSM